MRGVLLLAYRRVRTSLVQSLALALCVALSIAVPLSTNVIADEYERDLRARADATPLVVGATGSRFDLVFSSLYFRRSDLETVPYSLYLELLQDEYVDAIPMHQRFTARGWPVVGTGTEYFAFRGLRPVDGTIPLMLGDAVLGHTVARSLGLGVGDTVFSDQLEAFDITKPPALNMNIVGVLAPAGTPDDRAVFVDVRTAWVLEGLMHGHDDADKELRGTDVLSRNDQHVVVSPTLIEENRITDANAGSFHPHGDADTLPLTSVIVLPRSDKGRTIVTARFGASRTIQGVSPDDVVTELLGFVFRVRSLLNALSAVLGVSTITLLVLVGVLTFKIRGDEVRTLDAIGCRKGIVAMLYLAELGMIVAVGAGAAIVTSGVVVALAGSLLRTISTGA